MYLDKELRTGHKRIHAETSPTSEHILRLSKDDVQEIETALQIFKDTELGIENVSRWNFPLPTLQLELEYFSRYIHGQGGFFIICGLDANSYNAEDNTIMYLGLACYVADKRGLQDRKGSMLSHITSSKLWTVPEHKRHGIHSSKSLPFHNDMGCDILALQARCSANRGGSTYLSCAKTAYRYLVTNEPEVAEVLTTPNWPVQTSGLASRFYLGRAFTTQNGRTMCSMDPKRFGPQPGTDATHIPSLNPAQKHALKRVSSVAREKEIKLDLQTGDILFFNNWSMLHRRDKYEDDEATSRHMVRLWLRNTILGWPVPIEMLPPWLAAYGEKQPIADRLYPLEPKSKYEVPKYSAGSAAFVLED